MKKRRPFVLVEVLIAIALLALCLIPIASAPFRYFMKEANALKQMELERISDIAYRDFLLALPTIASFDSLPTEKEDAMTYDFGPYIVSIEGCGSYTYFATANFWIVRPKEPEKHALLRIELAFPPSKHFATHDLFIEKK